MMASDLEQLTAVVCSQKQIIVNVLENIEEKILEKLPLWTSLSSNKNQFLFSKKLLKILKHFNTVKYLCKNSLEDLSRELVVFAPETDSPDVERRSSNPFSLYNLLSSSTQSNYYSASATSTSDTSTISSSLELESTQDSSTLKETDIEDRGILKINDVPNGDVETKVIDSNEEQYSSDDKQFQIPPVPPPIPSRNPFSQGLTLNRSEPKQIDIKKESTTTSIISEDKLKDKISTMTIPDRLEEAQKIYINSDNNVDLTLKPSNLTLKSKQNVKKAKEKMYFEIKDLELYTGEFCQICHVISPEEFYVRTYQKIFERLEDNFNKYLNSLFFTVNSFKSKNQAKDSIDKFGFIYCSEKKLWFRVEILDWMESDDTFVLLNFIDYGYKKTCSYNKIISMTSEYAQYPRMAIKCHLAALTYPPPPPEETRPMWSDESIAILWEYELMSLQVVYRKKIRDSYAIDLWDPRYDESVGEFLVRENLAIHMLIDPQNGYLTEYDESEEEVSVLEFENINEAITGYDARDEFRVCRFTDHTGRCYKGPNCKLDHTKLSKDGITTDKTLTSFSTLCDIVYPAKGDRIEVIISGYISLCNFYIQITKNLSTNLSYRDNFIRLEEAMQGIDRIQSYEYFKVDPGIGELVLVKHNSLWKRGRCVEFEKERKFQIFLIDYGFKLTKRLSDLRQICEDFLYLPPQAMECILHDVEERKDVSAIQSKSFYSKILENQTFNAVVIETMEPLQLTMSDKDGVRTSQMLKSCGLATDRLVHFSSAEEKIELV